MRFQVYLVVLLLVKMGVKKNIQRAQNHTQTDQFEQVFSVPDGLSDFVLRVLEISISRGRSRLNPQTNELACECEIEIDLFSPYLFNQRILALGKNRGGF